MSGTTLTGATLITVGLSGLTASAGAGVFGVAVSGGNLGIAVLEAPKPPTGTDSRYWVAVTASDLSGSLNLAGDVTASVQDVTVSINQAGGTDAQGNLATPLDWKTAFSTPVDPGANLSPPPTTSLAITATAGGLSLSGTLASLDVFGTLTGSAGFSLSDSTVSPTVGGSVLTDATLLTLGLSNIQVAAGGGGFGIGINGGDLGIAVLEAPAPATGTDNRYWLAVVGSGLSGSLILGTGLSATVERPGGGDQHPGGQG